MRIAIIGAGVVGVTTAHFLQERGYTVTLYDSHPAPGQEASKANGGQLSYSFTDAMADPTLLAKIVPILLGRDEAFRILPRLNLSFLSWSLSFLANCAPGRAQKNSNQLLTLALRSAELMQTFHDRFGGEYQYQRAGKLVLLSKPADAAQRARIRAKQQQGCDVDIISFEQARQLEPALDRWRSKPQTAIYSAADEVGDAEQFCARLVRDLGEREVDCRFDTEVQAIEVAQGRVRRIVTQAGVQDVDSVVICAGEKSRELTRSFGIALPIHPVTGYSVTLDLGPHSPMTSVTALDHKIVFSRLGEQIRLAGFADINPRMSSLRKRIDSMVHTARQLAPDSADYRTVASQSWIGHRPMTPTSLPITGRTKVPGLFLNTGHGMFGWTLCAASAERLAQEVSRIGSEGETQVFVPKEGSSSISLPQ